MWTLPIGYLLPLTFPLQTTFYYPPSPSLLPPRTSPFSLTNSSLSQVSNEDLEKAPLKALSELVPTQA